MTVLCAETGRQHSENHVCLELKELLTSFHINQNPNLPAHGCCLTYTFRRHLGEISCIMETIKRLVIEIQILFGGMLELQKHVVPFVQMLWEVFKGSLL